MTGLTDRNSFIVAVVFYGLSLVYSLFLLRKGFREDNRVNYVLLLAAFGFHTFAMLQRGFSLQRCPINNIYEACMFISWSIVIAYLLIGLIRRLRFLGAFASPVLFFIGVFSLMPMLDTPQTPQLINSGFWVSLHASLSLFSYGAFGLAAVAGLMFLVQEHNLKFHKLQALFSLMPPIQRLEKIVTAMLVAGFVLLSVGLAVGALRLKPPQGMSFRGDPKVGWSLVVWVMYLGVLVMHWRFFQRGRRLAWAAIGSFSFVMLTFWGFNLLSRIHNP